MTNAPIDPVAAPHTPQTTSPASASPATRALGRHSAAPAFTPSAPAAVTRTLVLPPDLALVSLLGVRDEVLRAIEKGFPAADILVRETEIRVTGEPGVVDTVILLLSELIDVARAGTPLTADAVERAIGLLAAATHPADILAEDVLTARGRTIRAKSLGQKKYVDAIEDATITFGIGPAGTGKTYLAMAKAVDALARHQVSRIILTRPAVEAGENLGFLPGTLTDKIDPYLRPLYDALHDMLEPEALPKLMAAGTIEVAPLAYMRGRTLNDSFIILDEAQNTTVGQMKMFLTRLGFGSKVVVTGDASQVDLPGSQTSGLSVVENILGDIDDIEFCRLTSADVVRHELVGAIIDAYQRYDDRNAARRARTRSHNTARREYTS